MGVTGRILIAMGMLVATSAAGCKNDQLTFQSINPASGRMSGGQEVRIIGTGFDHLGSLEVRIGGKPATNVGVMGEDTIVLTTPEGREADANHAQDISILTADGKSILIRGAFTYQAGPSQPGQNGPNDDLRRRL